MRRAALLIPVLCAVAVLAACSSEIAGTPTPAAPLTGSPEDAYIAAIMDTPGLTSTVPRAELLQVGRSICDAIGTPGLSSAQMREELGKSKWGPQVALVVINAAETHLCPKKYYVPTPLEFATVAPAPTTTVAPTMPPAAATSFSAGTYEVGTGPGEIPPGKYKSPGPTGGGSCYYSRLKNNDGAYDDIIGNNLTEGPSVMTVQASDGYVEISGCTFTKA